MDMSVVIPSYNSARWLPSMIEALVRSLEQSESQAEMVVVNDGSTDKTVQALADSAAQLTLPLRAISNENQCVYAARLTGAQSATARLLVFLDSCVLCEPEAFTHLEDCIKHGEAATVRIDHVRTAADVPLVGRFWEILTLVFWGSYLRNPILTTISPANFDRLSKGTGFTVSSPELMLSTYERIGLPTSKFVSDDTKPLREISGRTHTVLGPEFRVVYLPRTTVRKFLTHAFLREALFVGPYYGTSTVRSLVLWVIALSVPIAVVDVVLSVLSGKWLVPGALLALFVVVVSGLLLVSARNRAPRQAVVSFLLNALLFGAVFWAGVVRGLWLRPRIAGNG